MTRKTFTKVCDQCGITFTTLNRRTIRCSYTCRNHANARPPEERFWKHVNKTETCWLWTGRLNQPGYGLFDQVSRQLPVLAHRFSYALHHGAMPAGMVTDHLCRVRHCVNPAHLEAVTHRENILRGEGTGAQHARQTHCKRGHLLLALDKQGRRPCRACERIRYWRKKDALRAKQLENA